MRISAVLGACGGLGRSVVQRLLDAGDFVFLLDLEHCRAEARPVLAGASGARAAFLACDLGKPHSIAAAFAEIANRGPLAALVNAAGVIRRAPFLDMGEAELEALCAVNITGSFLALQHAARLMAAGGGGRIVNIASVHGLRTAGERSAYAMSKGAMLALTRALAVELAAQHILVNAVAPGPVAAGMQHAESEARRQWLAATPLGRVATADEVADAAAFLASPANTFITGETLLIDGGASARIAG